MSEPHTATVYMYNFQYHYDCKKQKFNVPTDLNSFIVGELTWDWIEDHEIFNIKIIEKRKATMTKDPLTGNDDVVYHEI